MQRWSLISSTRQSWRRCKNEKQTSPPKLPSTDRKQPTCRIRSEWSTVTMTSLLRLPKPSTNRIYRLNSWPKIRRSLVPRPRWNSNKRLRPLSSRTSCGIGRNYRNSRTKGPNINNKCPPNSKNTWRRCSSRQAKAWLIIGRNRRWAILRLTASGASLSRRRWKASRLRICWLWVRVTRPWR